MTTDSLVDSGSSSAAAPAVGRRSPWRAALATLLAPGLGHVYAGRLRRGLGVWALFFAASAGVLQGTMMADSRLPRLLLVVLWVAAIAGGVADAARVARRADPAAPRRGYQRPAVYAALALAGIVLTQLVVEPMILSRWRSFRLQAGNMAPTLFAGDYVMTVRGTPPLTRGRVVTRLTDEGYESVGRLAGVPGDTLWMRDGVLWANGREEPSAGRIRARNDDGGWEEGFGWQRDFLARDTAGYAPTPATWGPLVVPEGQVFVLGDNGPGSLDSRHLGFVPVEWLTGEVRWIYFSRDAIAGVRAARIGTSVR